MKVGLVLDTTLDSNAGVQQLFKGLARFLIKKKIEVRFLVPPIDKSNEFFNISYSFGRNFNPPFRTTSVPTVIAFNQKKIKEVIQKEKFDIIHVSSPFGPFIGAMAVKYADCPVITSYTIVTQNEFYRFGMQLLKPFFHHLYKKIVYKIANSDIALKDAKITIGGDFKLIPAAIDTTIFNSEKITKLKKFCDNKKNVIFLGRLEHRKGVSFLLDAFKIVKNSVPNSRLIIAGIGPLEKKLKAKVKNERIQDVEFLGFINESDKASFYKTADLCVFPGIFGECFGYVLVEAMSSGKATIAFDNPGYSFVLGKVPDLLVENKNVDKLAKLVIKLLLNDKLREEFAQKCLLASKEYDWENQGPKIIEIYESAIKLYKKN